MPTTQSTLSAARIDDVLRRRRTMTVFPGLFIACLFLLTSGCGGDNPPAQNGSGAGSENSADGSKSKPKNFRGTQEAVHDVRLIEDGFTKAEREEFFHLTMGSELFPLRWMQNLISSETGRPFLENIERFGLIPDPADSDGLPIGLTAADSVDVRGVGKMVGMNCSACHTGIITFEGASVIVVGGSSLFDVEKFTGELFASAGATAKDPEKLVSFVHRLWDSGRGRELPSHDAATRILAHLLKDAAARNSLTDELKSLSKNASEVSPNELMQSFTRLAGQAKDELRGGLLHGLEQRVRGSITRGLGELKAELKGVSDDLKSQAIDHLSEDFFIVSRLLAGRIAFAKKLAELKTLNLATTHGGPGRADDFGAGRNLLFNSPEPMTGPCSIPPLFGLKGVQWADWDGNTSSTMGRSMLTALAGGAAFNSETFTSTVPTKNVARLEELAARLKSPAWPVDLFGKLDGAKVNAGKTLFEEHCAKCHRPEMINASDVPLASIYPLSEIGTDPNRLRNYLKPLDGKSFAEALQATSQAYLDAANRDSGVSPEEAVKLSEGHPNSWRNTDGYAARSLAGIWSTAPYFHNGSVPTLWHVLSPQTNRPRKFSVGSSRYDPEKVGFVFEVSDSSPFLFDTTVSGNSNSGHEFGTGLSDTEKSSLIEFLKSL